MVGLLGVGTAFADELPSGSDDEKTTVQEQKRQRRCGPDQKCSEMNKKQCSEMSKKQCSEMSKKQCSEMSKKQCSEMSKKQCSEMSKKQCSEMSKKQHPKLSKEQRQGMREQRQAIMKLGEAARNETDPVKKEALVAGLRVKLNEVADTMHEAHQKRLEKAAKDLEKLKERIADADKNRDQMIEEQVQKVLAGEPLRKPKSGGSEGERRKKGPQPEDDE